jgi:Zn finger protein HypA/HybF involved in hydrogenase expression
MAGVANCKKCGALFLQTAKRDICDKCFEAQNKMVSEINTFVIMSPDEIMPVEDILEKFKLSRNEFEALFQVGKFVKIAKKVMIKCSKCGKNTTLENKTNFLCHECMKKLQNEI